MKLKTGSVVAAEAGRDCGGFFVVTDIDENRVYIADGKSRKLKCPKAKNIKHIRLTNSMIDLNDITDKKLRAALRTIREAE
ncbi:MAG TPA: KOW domain-containing RNA-binding protein [Ruminococcus sp.]|nr:KOW domain-containing RNA-binding protein [Ruminococcus sp.]